MEPQMPLWLSIPRCKSLFVAMESPALLAWLTMFQSLDYYGRLAQARKHPPTYSSSLAMAVLSC
eukprot:scaffold210080_cov42-Prasinocladus_malaysianus.AAC.2